MRVAERDGDGDVGRCRGCVAGDAAGGVDARRRDDGDVHGVRSAMGRARRWSPVEPEVSQATCANGVVTVPTVTPATGPTGVIYAVDPAGAYDAARRIYTVTVTATLADGYGWGQLPDGWLPGVDDGDGDVDGDACRARRVRW